MKGVVVDSDEGAAASTSTATSARTRTAAAHRGVALSCGTLEAASGTLTCAMHRWQYDARTGRGINPRGVVLRLPMKIEDDGIWVEVDGDAA